MSKNRQVASEEVRNQVLESIDKGMPFFFMAIGDTEKATVDAVTHSPHMDMVQMLSLVFFNGASSKEHGELLAEALNLAEFKRNPVKKLEELMSKIFESAESEEHRNIIQGLNSAMQADLTFDPETHQPPKA